MDDDNELLIALDEGSLFRVWEVVFEAIIALAAFVTLTS